MKITDALLGEHAVMYELFEHIRETTHNADDVPEIHRLVLVVERLLLGHARIEEDLLFPALETHLGPMGPLAVMRSEHEEIEGLLTAAKEATDLSVLKSVIDQFLALTYGHFQKEEQVLFAMAQQVLDEPALTDLGSKWATRRNVIVDGQGCLGAA
jgi:hemerythrin-like domain-containing protein